MESRHKSQKENDENFGPYWTEALPGHFWSRGCAQVVRLIPPSQHLRFDPVKEWKRCSGCGYQIPDPYNRVSNASLRLNERSVLCSTCDARFRWEWSERKKAEDHQPDGPNEPARCCCGFLLPDCVVAQLPACPAWDVAASHPVSSKHYSVPLAMWTFRLPLVATRTKKEKQGRLF
jgi:hypothetical protein